MSDTLAIRWFTPRGRMAKEAFLDDLRREEGANLHEILASLRRDGISPDYLDLRGIDLSGEDLAGARLLNVDFSGARLDRCNLAHANLQGSRFVRASMRRTTLRSATLSRSDLTRADLTDADLSEAILEGTRVESARMTRTRMTRTRVYRVSLTKAELEDVDLSSVQRERPIPPTRVHRVTAPPVSEPRRPSRPLRRNGSEINPTRAYARTRSFTRPQREKPKPDTADFDEALATLIHMRELVGSITVQIGGEEVLLYSGQGADQERRAA